VTVDDTERLMEQAAMQAEEKPFFVASTLATYRTLREMDNAALAAYLGCTEAALYRLALCRRPDGDGSMFRSEVERIAQHTGCNVEALANVLRTASVAAKMHAADPGMLLAARDRISEEPDVATGAKDVQS
jgi:hypothetical protein